MPTAIRSKNNKTDIHMKHAFTKGLFVAATATLIAACSTDDAADQMPVAPAKSRSASKPRCPRAALQIEVDESNGRFSGSWEATDELTVYAKGSTPGEETPKFTYDADAKVFKGQLTEKKQDWTYQAVYPAVDATPLNIPFGAERTQKGSNFNGAYDPLVSALVTHDGAEPGKTPQGEAVDLRSETSDGHSGAHVQDRRRHGQGRKGEVGSTDRRRQDRSPPSRSTSRSTTSRAPSTPTDSRRRSR